MRYSLTSFFSSRDLGGLYLFLGHQPDRSMNKITKIEHDHYLRKDDHERLKIAKRHYEAVTELLKNKEKLLKAITSVKSKLKSA
jgi:hypothetical protein